jgi:hypothetical protein
VFNNAPRDKVNRNAAGCANQEIDPMCRNLAGYAPNMEKRKRLRFPTTDFKLPCFKLKNFAVLLTAGVL